MFIQKYSDASGELEGIRGYDTKTHHVVVLPSGYMLLNAYVAVFFLHIAITKMQADYLGIGINI